MIKTTIYRDYLDIIYRDSKMSIFVQSEAQPRKYCIRQIKQPNESFMYYLCDVIGISKDDSYVYGTGTLLGISYEDLRDGDITLSQ